MGLISSFMFTENFSKSKIIIGIGIVIVGILGRFLLINYVGIPNFEIITALTLTSAVFLGGVWTFVVPLSIIAITDMVIGNSPVLVFTWSAFAVIGIFGWIFKKYQIPNTKYRILGLTSVGIISSIFFFLYTNFGWWLVSGMYPHTLDGLIQAYIMGLPFFKNNLIGNLIFVPIFSGAAILIIYLKANYLSAIKFFKAKVKVN